tara:strand:+ start:1302 stop:1760 length:459 start_codon:yes stop_codon:yes gene_type:complete
MIHVLNIGEDMPIPKRGEKEPRKEFMSRCMGDSVMHNEYPDKGQRAAVCMSKAADGLSLIEAVDLQSRYNSEADEKAGYPPNCNEGYIEKDGKCVPISLKDADLLWTMKMKNQLKEETDAGYKYRDPKTGEIYEFARKGVYTKNGRILVPAY